MIYVAAGAKTGKYYTKSKSCSGVRRLLLERFPGEGKITSARAILPEPMTILEVTEKELKKMLKA